MTSPIGRTPSSTSVPAQRPADNADPSKTGEQLRDQALANAEAKKRNEYIDNVLKSLYPDAYRYAAQARGH